MKEKREDESWLKKLKEYFVMDPESDYADEDEELEQEKPWVTILTFVGLAVLAGIICFVLWQFSHPDTSEGEGGNADPGTVEDSLDSSELSGEEETVPDDSLSGQSSVSPEEPPEQDTRIRTAGQTDRKPVDRNRSLRREPRRWLLPRQRNP